MRRFIITTLAALGTLAGPALIPAPAAAQVTFGLSVGVPTPVQYYGGGWGHRHYGRPHRPYWIDRPYYAPRRFHGGAAYVGPVCRWRQVWVDTPWGPRVRDVQVCR